MNRRLQVLLVMPFLIAVVLVMLSLYAIGFVANAIWVCLLIGWEASDKVLLAWCDAAIDWLREARE